MKKYYIEQIKKMLDLVSDEKFLRRVYISIREYVQEGDRAN